MKVRFMRRSVVVAVIATAIGVAGCGGSGSSAKSTQGAGTSAAGGSPSAGPIKFMTIASVGSPVASYPDIQGDAAAAAKAINAAGGIHGHKIESLFCNSKGNANQAILCVREAVQDHVVAVVGRLDLFDDQTTPILASAGIPDLGTWAGGDAIDTTSPDSFPLSAGSFGSYSSDAYAFKDQGYKRLAVVSLDIPVALGGAATVVKAGQAAGMTVGSIIKIPPTGVSDYTPYAEQIKKQGADSAVMAIGPGAFTGMVKADSAVGANVPIGVCVICGLSSPGLIFGSPYPAATDTSNPGIAEFNKELVADGLPKPSAGDTNVYSGLNAWLAMHAAADVAKTIKGHVTSSSIVQALKTTSNLDVEGLLKWSPADFGRASLGKFPRLPAVPYSFLKVTNSRAIVNAKLPSVNDPIKASR